VVPLAEKITPECTLTCRSLATIPFQLRERLSLVIIVKVETAEVGPF